MQMSFFWPRIFCQNKCTEWSQTRHPVYEKRKSKNFRLNTSGCSSVYMMFVLCNRSWQNARMPKLWLEDPYRTGHTLDLTSHYKVTQTDFKCVCFSVLVQLVCYCVCCVSPLAEFPTPKTELVQKFQVLYVGMMPVARPLGEK